MAAAAAVEGTSNWTRDGTGFTWDLSPVQRKILDEFEVSSKEALERIKFPHEPLREAAARFLRARKYDVAAATEMVDKSCAWRDEAKLEELATTPTEELLGCPVDELNAFYPCAYLPVLDSQSRPVYIERTGQINVPALLCSTTQEGLLAWHKKQLVTQTPMRMARATALRTDGRVVNSSTTIMDLHGFTMGMLMGSTKEYLGAITKMDSDNFPETLGATLIINAPTIFSVAWGIVKAFIDPRTQAKVTVLGSAYEEKLTELMGGKDRVPVEYGGTLVVPGMFSSPLKKQAVHAGKTFSLALRVSAGKGVRVRWMSDPADVEFEVVAVTGTAAELDAAVADPDAFDKSSASVVYAKKAHPNSKTETVQCEVPGSAVAEETVFIATWDNSAGWSQRVVRYFAKKLPSAEEAAEEYVAELKAHGIEGAPAVVALRGRGFEAAAAAMETETGPAATAASSAEGEASASASSADASA